MAGDFIRPKMLILRDLRVNSTPGHIKKSVKLWMPKSFNYSAIILA